MNKTQFCDWASNDQEFKSYNSTKSRLAIKALPHAYDWYMSNKTELLNKEIGVKKSRKLARAYVSEKFRPDPVEYGYGSIWVSWIFYWILSAVINWVIKRLIDDWLFKK